MLRHPETSHSWEQLPHLCLNIQGEGQGDQMLVRGGAGGGVPEGTVVTGGLGHSQNHSTERERRTGEIPPSNLCWCLPLTKPTGKLEDKGAH